MKYLVAIACLAGSMMLCAAEPEAAFDFSNAANRKVRALENYNNALRTEVPGESIKMLLESLRQNPDNEGPYFWLIRIAIQNKSLNESGKQLIAVALEHPHRPKMMNIALDMALYGRSNISKKERAEWCGDLIKVLDANDLAEAQGTRNFLPLINLLYRYNFLAYDKDTYLNGEAVFDRYWQAMTPAHQKRYAAVFLNFFSFAAKYQDKSRSFWFPFGKTPYQAAADRVRALTDLVLTPSPNGYRMEDMDAAAVAIENLNDIELLKAYEKALVNSDYLKNPNNANTLAYLKAVMNYDLDDAERLASFAVLQENNAAFWDTLAWIYYQQKKYDKAKECIQKAFNGKDILLGENVINEHAGDIFAAAGDKAKAKEYYRRALQSEAEVRFDKSVVEQKLNALEQD